VPINIGLTFYITDFQDDLGIENESYSRGYVTGYFKEVKAVK
jgi:hypothetical protein